MRRALFVFASLCLSSSAVAADDPGLMLNDIHAHARQTGMAAQATFTMPLGKRHGTMRAADAPTFDLRAGPSMTSYGGYANTASRTRVAPTVGFSARADAPTRFTLAGQTLWQTRGPLGYALGEELEQGPRHNLSTGAAVAIGVGVAVLVGALVLRDRIVDSSE